MSNEEIHQHLAEFGKSPEFRELVMNQNIEVMRRIVDVQSEKIDNLKTMIELYKQQINTHKSMHDTHLKVVETWLKALENDGQDLVMKSMDRFVKNHKEVQ